MIHVVTSGRMMVLLFLTTTAAAFTVSYISKQSNSYSLLQRYCDLYGRQIHTSSALQMSKFMDRLPSESDDAYFRRIVATASSPQSFENAVLNEKMPRDDNVTNVTNHNGDGTTTTQNTTKSKYVRAEEWEEQEREKAKSSPNWEERVQFDGQVNGNRFNQNEILRHHLKGF